MKAGPAAGLRFLLLAAGLPLLVQGQELWFNHAELEWQTFETDHFLIHYHEGTERSAREAATVAEKIYGPVTNLYGHEPAAKTEIVIKDVDDVSNGIAYYYDNKIEIWARPLDFDLRGSHRWMQDVITHEFVHIVQLATAMKFSTRIPGLYFQILNYEDEKRDDVLYGYPNVLVSYPYPGVNIPPWFAEGVAQFMYPGANYDFWDSHRDMLLRDRTLNGKVLSLSAMNSFGKRGIGNESVYNQGFALVRYIAGRFGEAALAEISRLMSAPLAVSVSRAIKRATGASGRQLHREWLASLEKGYASDMALVGASAVSGEVLIDQGSSNLHPVWHPRERKFAFLSNRAADYFGQTDLYLYDFATEEVEKLAGTVVSAPCWSVDGKTLYYAGRTEPGRTGAKWLDLFAYDLDAGEREQLTFGQRATSPVLLDSGQAIAYLTVWDGTSNIHRLELAGGKIDTLTHFTAGEYIHSLTLDEVDSLIIFDVTLNHGRRLWQLRLADGSVSSRANNLPADSDVRDPFADDRGLLMVTDASGVFNLYWQGRGADGGYGTNVIGGAFMPSRNGHGQLLYSLYQDGGYKIAYLADPQPLAASQVGVPPDRRPARPSSPQASPDATLSSRSYQETMSRPFLLPRLMLDYGTLKPGLYLYANEVLDRLTMFGGASLNRLGDTDYFLLFEFRKFRPTLYAQIFSVRRHVTNKFKWYDYEGTDDLRFTLLEGIAGGRFPLGAHRFWLEMSLSQYREHIKQRLADLSGGFSFPYFRGASLAARWQLVRRKPQYGGNMFPSRGYEWQAEVRAERNGLIGGFGISEDYGTLVPEFVEHNTYRLTLNFKRYAALNRRYRVTAAYDLRLGWLSNQNVDDFFAFFGGGSPGLRGYTFYDSTAQGSNLMIHTLAIRAPLVLERNISLAQLIVQNVSLGLVVQAGDAFQGSWLRHIYKTSAGVELRVNGSNFYVFPFALSYEVHRPLGHDFRSYRHYLTLLFDF